MDKPDTESTQEKKQIGTVKVTVQTEHRLRAINALASAIETLAQALNSAPKVEIKNNLVASDGGACISVDTAEQVNRTEIVTDV